MTEQREKNLAANALAEVAAQDAYWAAKDAEEAKMEALRARIMAPPPAEDLGTDQTKEEIRREYDLYRTTRHETHRRARLRCERLKRQGMNAHVYLDWQGNENRPWVVEVYGVR